MCVWQAWSWIFYINVHTLLRCVKELLDRTESQNRMSQRSFDKNLWSYSLNDAFRSSRLEFLGFKLMTDVLSLFLDDKHYITWFVALLAFNTRLHIKKWHIWDAFNLNQFVAIYTCFKNVNGIRRYEMINLWTTLFALLSLFSHHKNRNHSLFY